MGTPDFAVSALEEMILAGHQILAVVTQPDKPKGRGKTVQYSPVKETALKYQIEVLQPIKVREPSVIDSIRTYEPDVIVVVAFGQIITDAILKIPKYGCINIHASLLPKYRGAAPIQWSIIEGEKETGVTAMLMDSGIDTGDILLKKAVNIAEKETGGSLHDKLKAEGGKLLIETLRQLEAGTITRTPQGEAATFYAKKLDKSLGQIDWSKEAVDIERLVRGLNPWPSASTHIQGKTIKLWDCDVLFEDYEGGIGEIVDIKPEGILVKTGRNTIMIRKLQMEGKKSMTADAFLRGNPIEKGMFFQTKIT